LDQTGPVALERHRELGVAEPGQHAQGVVTRLRDAADRQQTEPAVQQARWPAQLLEVVRRHPVRERVDPASG
jgi:hypothetical protein